jgi:enamine deaminase RidA (YjgF/YER057c/UK114 family)
MNKVESRVIEAGLNLPSPTAAIANYQAVRRSGTLLIVSGQLPIREGALAFIGAVGRDISVEDGKKAAEICLLNALGQLEATIGDLDKVRCLRLGGFIQCAGDFKEHAIVLNGASDLLVRVMGENGRHARAAVGCVSLPLGAAVEVEATFEVIDE